MASTTLYKYNPATSSTNQYKGTFSWWMKRSGITATNYLISIESGSERFLWYLDGNDKFAGGYRGASGSPNIDFSLSSAPQIRDTNGWYHCVIAYDTTQSTASDRLKFYINNVQHTVSNVGGDIPQNTVLPMNISSYAQPLYIGSYVNSVSFFDGIMSHFYFIDGQQLTPSSFGEYDANGVWKINTSPSVTYGNFGYLILKNDNVYNDQSGNGLNFTKNGGSLTKTEDNPSNVFATFNALQPTSATFSNGNTNVISGSAAWYTAPATLGVTSGKYYWEVKAGTISGSNYIQAGVCSESAASANLNTYHANTTYSYAYHWDGQKYINNSASSFGTAISTGDIIMIALDCDNGFIYAGLNGTWQNSGDPTSGGSGTGAITTLASNQLWFPTVSAYSSTHNANFGNGYFGTTAVASAGTNASGIGIFEYDVPSGYTALSTKGLNT